MWRYNTGTPCPAPIVSHRVFSPTAFVDGKQSRSNVSLRAFDEFGEDNTTQNIARLIQSEFENAAPKRRQTIAQKPRRNAPISVHEDNAPMSNMRHSMQSSSMARSTIGAKPARKIRLETVKETASLKPSSAQNNSPGIALDTFDIKLPVKHERPEYNEPGTPKQDQRTKDERRRTIWVPSDDTTVATIHPGAYNHTLNDFSLCIPQVQEAGTDEKKATPRSDIAGARRDPRLPLSKAPKRAVLGSLASIQANVNLGDIAGNGGGKENIPPSMRLSKLKHHEEPASRPSPYVTQTAKPMKAVASMIHGGPFAQPTATSQARVNPVKKRPAIEAKEGTRKIKATQTLCSFSSIAHKQPDRPSLRDTINAARGLLPKHIPADTKLPDIRCAVDDKLSRYPVLSNDILQPQLYEDNWLQHQEIALTQLINAVFEQADPPLTAPYDGVSELRSSFLRSYQQPDIATLHKRLKASLLYGALSMPKDTPNAPRLREDIGLRRQFIDLWLTTYNLDALQAAAETVFGRTMVTAPRDAVAITRTLGLDSSGSSSREKELRRFLVTFLVYHEDVIQQSSRSMDKTSCGKDDQGLTIGSPEWLWHRTVLHSLMLIRLLDIAKASDSFSNNLFQPWSIRKSSISVLHALSRMLLPSLGDIVRPLGHIAYEVSHVQEPLQEYTFHVKNLATDLRTGVILTRFVELLLYPATSSLNTRSDETVTLTLPDGQMLKSMLSDNKLSIGPLVQHLKVPCLSRAQKLHNAQIALSALTSANDLSGNAAVNTKAEDIVDGHREKTLSLLWSLVSRWGLKLLVDWPLLNQEIACLSSAATLSISPANSQSINEEETRLETWASLICATQNITLTNLTTSFSSTGALSAIIDTYAQYLPNPSTSPNHPTTGTAAEKLRTLGCSSSFISLFTSSAIQSRSSTISLLAFLASRLLPLARTHRAVSTIQRFWRLRLLRRTVSARVKAMRVARGCQRVVKEKERIEGLVVGVQRRWREGLRARRVMEEVWAMEFQSAVRGWSVRRNLGMKGGRGRVLGGW